MKNEIRIFFTALMFYTRIPCPKNIDHHPDNINKATRYFPLIGWIVGGISFAAYWISSLVFSDSISVVFSLIAGVLTTGAFHEDGLADVVDGFGGGWTKEKILDIMKDSRVGAYGVIALIFLFLLKFLALKELLTLVKSPFIIAVLFISYHSLARGTAINIVFASQYSRDDETSKAKPIAKTHGKIEIAGAYFFGLLPIAALCFISLKLIAVLLPLLAVFYFSKRYFEKWIHGYTGDCLGAVEQIAECVTILSFLALWKFM
ncbi:adenosylcobinamide-GDP ribazoletransferase [Galbibacter mesophilus]|uniref:adenosylcobinamide-GDP ribazoletransferase n=1 Tax=Galbibacter mesophilus TaxID=379069 RepID=UPI00191CB831|nr:adenosylcobinamide-GDP ribazoletransferase [Galbibacter mesophilus]MCM5663746.1 adenosylcobinamide-GDP ribazoletransferase [Galbibacter mesophilus]